MTIIEIVKAHLVENGFDGICNPPGECGCVLEDLVPCYGICDDCEPGYSVFCDGCGDGIVVNAKPKDGTKMYCYSCTPELT